MENKILEAFKKKIGDKVKDLDLIISIDDTESIEINCEIMEKKDNGKVWDVVCDKNGNVRSFYELGE